MQSQYRYSQPGTPTSGPAWFYGYCHDSRKMRMMNYPDYVRNMQTGYSNLYQDPASVMQQWAGMMQNATASTPQSSKGSCNCHQEEDCGCSCCIRSSDTVEYARCGETRRIPITFENDSRRDRQVTLELGSFATEGGQQLGWQASLSESQFTLGPCGEKTVLVTVTVDCGKGDPAGNVDGNVRSVPLEACKVGYATLRAEGCIVRPLVVAIAAIPDHCGAHRIGCLCGCCS